MAPPVLRLPLSLTYKLPASSEVISLKKTGVCGNAIVLPNTAHFPSGSTFKTLFLSVTYRDFPIKVKPLGSSIPLANVESLPSIEIRVIFPSLSLLNSPISET